MATLIYTPEDLDNIRNDVYDHYELASDIDMSEWGNWTPINIFYGNLDGNGHVVSNLTIDTTNVNAGLFSRISGSTITRIGLEDVSISSTNRYVGGLVGVALNSSHISESYVTGNVYSGAGYAGGLIGEVSGGTTVTNCYSITHTSGYTSIGGLFGYINGGIIRNNYSASTIYATGSHAGSFYGRLGSGNSYSDNFLDKTIGTGNLGGSSIKGVTTQELKSQATFPATWDFDEVWGIDEGESYPYLLAFQDPLPIQESREVSSYVGEIHSKIDISVVRPAISHNVEVKSHARQIMSNTEVGVSVLRNVEDYSSSIHSNVHTSVISPNNNIVEIKSHSKPIHSNVETIRERQPVHVERQLTSHMSQIQVDTDVSTYVPPIPIQAFISVIESHSRVSALVNLSNSTYIVNPSYCEVVK